MPTSQAQIDADAALARRLMEEDLAQLGGGFPYLPIRNTPSPARQQPARPHPNPPHQQQPRHSHPFQTHPHQHYTNQPHPPRQPQRPTPPHYPQPNQTRAPPSNRRFQSSQNVRYPFARGTRDFDTTDMLDEMFHQVADAQPRSFESLLEFGNFPGRGHVLNRAPQENRRATPPDDVLQRLFGDDMMEGGRFVVMPPMGAFGGSDGAGGRGEGGAMEMMNMLFSQAFQPFQGMGGQGTAGPFTNIGDMLRAVMQGGDGRETYEDWLAVIERMGGNVNRGATDEEVNRLQSRTFERKKAGASGAGAAGSSGAGPSSMRDRRSGAGGNAHEEEEVDKCAVCLGEYEDGEDVKELPCMHMFHSECVDRWLKLNRICPVCKHSIREGDGPPD